MVIAQSIIIGVISGVISSVCYALAKRMLCPKIKIAPVAIYNTERNLFVIKIINRSKIRITDVECCLQYYKYLSNGYVVYELDPHKKISNTIEKFVNDKDIVGAPSLYAVQCGYKASSVVSFDEKDKLVFSIRGIHPISGTATYKTCEYNFDGKQIVKDAEYDAGDNIGIHANK